MYVRVQGSSGQPLEILISTTPFREGAGEGEQSKGNTVPPHDDSVPYYLRPKDPIIGRASTESILVAATGRPVSHSDIVAAVGTLGGTPFRVHSRYIYI